MKRFSKEGLCFLGYVVIGVFTFAFAASDPRNCSYDIADNVTCPPGFEGMVAGMIGGAFWPLYWPWTAAELIRGDEAYAVRRAEMEAPNDDR